MTTTADLLAKQCHPQTNGLNPAQIQENLAAIDRWSLQDGMIVKVFSFQNYHETLAFVNAIAAVIHREDHHPELIVTYKRCTVKFNTHSVNQGQGGISDNDFICAAKLDAVFAQARAN